MIIFKRTISLALIIAVGFVFVLALIATYLVAQFPADREIRGCLVTKLYQVDLCPKSKNYARLPQISKNVERAIVLTEDSSFYTHRGFDFQELQNSLKTNLEKGHFARGGSTITQQLAKNLFLSQEKTLRRKILEALITMRLEKVLTKSEILEKYLNVVQFGKDLFGIKPAAQFYFKKQPSELSVLEASFLAFLLPSPEKYSKSYFQGKLTPFARKRIQQIIEHLYDYKRISENDYLFARDDLDHFLVGEKKESEINFENVDEESADITE